MDTSIELKDQVLSLVSRIITPVREDNNSPLNKATKRLETFVKETLMPILNCASPDNSSEIVDAFQLSLERFEGFTLFPAFESKQLIGVGGAFSSGKSKLLNTIIGENLLPVQTNPSTVVPTFIIHSSREEVGVINIFNVCNLMSLEEFKSISYDFIENHGIELRHLIKRAFISSSRLAFDNLSLLDTPGYSKPDINTYSDRTDEKVASEQLSTADYVIWVMDMENGTLKRDDIEFLQKLNLNKPILMVLSKAEKLCPEEVENVRQEVIANLASIGISADAVIPFSAVDDSPYPAGPIIDWLQTKNNPKNKSSIPLHLKRVFHEYHNYYAEQLYDANRRLANAKLVATAVDAQDDYTKQCLKDLEVEALNQRNEFQELKTELSKHLNEFFGMVKEIGRLAGIELPEPEEIEMLTDDTLDLRNLLREYCKKHNIKSSSMDEYIHNAMSAESPGQGKVLSWYESNASTLNHKLDFSMITDQKMNFLQQAFIYYAKTRVFSFSVLVNKIMNDRTNKLEI